MRDIRFWSVEVRPIMLEMSVLLPIEVRVDLCMAHSVHRVVGMVDVG